MGAVINIANVSGTGPTYTLSVDSALGAQADDLLMARLDGQPEHIGGVYRVVNVPFATTIVVEDDVGEGEVYGKPAPGPASWNTPTPGRTLPQPVEGGKYFPAQFRRSMRLLDVAGSLGDPPSGDYTDGFFSNWTAATPVSEAAYDISVSFDQLAPDKAGLLTGTALILSGATSYTAKLPSGLPGSWGSYVPGSTVTNLITTAGYILTAADASTRFRAGRVSDPSTAGVLTHIVGGVPGDIYDIGSLGVGILGVIEVIALDPYNSLWLKANARINYSQLGEGLASHVMSHSEAGDTDALEVLFDNVNASPSFQIFPSIVVANEVLKYLSGIAYYGSGTILEAQFTAASGIFTKAYHPTNVVTIAVTGSATKAVNPSAVPTVNDNFPVSGLDGQVTLNVADSEIDPEMVVRLFKPTGLTASDSVALARSINSYGTVSSSSLDRFQDEDKRLVLGTTTSWDPTAILVDGNLQVRNGTLVHGNDGDYSGFSGDQAFERRIDKASASGGTIRTQGLSVTSIGEFGTGSANVFLQLEDESIWFDLGLDFGLNNGNGSGDSPTNSKGAKVIASGFNTDFSFGLFSTGNNSNRYRVRVVYRTTGLTMTELEGT